MRSGKVWNLGKVWESRKATTLGSTWVKSDVFIQALKAKCVLPPIMRDILIVSQGRPKRI